MAIIDLLIVVAPIILYTLLNIIIWCTLERKLDRPQRVYSKRRVMRKFVSTFVLLGTSVFAAICLTNIPQIYDMLLPFYGSYENAVAYVVVTQVILPITYTLIVLGAVELVQNIFIGLVRMCIPNKKKQANNKTKKSTSKKQQTTTVKKPTKKSVSKTAKAPEDNVVRNVVIPATREFIAKYKNTGNIKQIIKKHKKEYINILTTATKDFINNEEIVEHYFNKFTN